MAAAKVAGMQPSGSCLYSKCFVCSSTPNWHAMLAQLVAVDTTLVRVQPATVCHMCARESHLFAVLRGLGWICAPSGLLFVTCRQKASSSTHTMTPSSAWHTIQSHSSWLVGQQLTLAYGHQSRSQLQSTR
jgi:hypothetical protein